MFKLILHVVYSNAAHRTSLAPILGVFAHIEAMRGRLFLWVPVFLGIGIGMYFALPVEPGTSMLAAFWLLAALLTLAGLRLGPLSGAEDIAPIAAGGAPVLYALALIVAGLGLAGTRAEMVAAPVLDFRFYGAVEGRIIHVDRSGSDAVRLTLDQVRLDRVSPSDTPALVRISLHGDQGFITPEPGLRIMTTASLSGPSGPVEPGGFDFQRYAWFRQLGGVGYTRVPVLAIAPAQAGRAGLFMHRLRSRISQSVQSIMPGEAGAFAAAITTGDRSGMSRETLANLRGSNLAHLLAISGLHMGLLTGFVFAAARYVLALFAWVSLRFPTKKIAAILALAAGVFYLGLSGGNVATQRAFIMVAVMFVAILFDRRALTLRSIALAAIIVLILRPEALVQPGFQMSFSATTALIAVFAWLRDWQSVRGWRAPRWAQPILAVVISSAVAGLATAPFAAAHFNMVSHFGLIANLLSVPLMGAIVMPGAVVAALLAPVGLSWLALAVMAPMINWILGVAAYVTSLEGAIGHVPTPDPMVVPLIALGGLMFVLARTPKRIIGIPLILAGFFIWSQVERPGLLISSSGGLVGLMTDQGRVLNKPTGESFAANNWLENDGWPVPQQQAFERAGFTGQKGWLEFRFGGQDVVHLSGRGATGKVAQACAGADVVILSGKIADIPASGLPAGLRCRIFDRDMLSETGTLAIYASDEATAENWRIIGANAAAGRRIWHGNGR